MHIPIVDRPFNIAKLLWLYNRTRPIQCGLDSLWILLIILGRCLVWLLSEAFFQLLKGILSFPTFSFIGFLAFILKVSHLQYYYIFVRYLSFGCEFIDFYLALMWFNSSAMKTQCFLTIIRLRTSKIKELSCHKGTRDDRRVIPDNVWIPIIRWRSIEVMDH